MGLLDLKNVDVEHCDQDNVKTLVHDVSFSVEESEVVVVVGASGCGKTTILRSVTRLFSPASNLSIRGKIEFRGENILTMSDDRLNEIRHTSIRHIFQEPALVFNPVLRIESQLRLLFPDNTNEVQNDVYCFLKELGMERPQEVLRLFPHQLSTGMLQRIAIAISVASKPAILLADEPTSAVDANHRSRILTLLVSHCKSAGMGLIISTHDLHIARRYADTVIVMFGGRIVEKSPAQKFLDRPIHPYSRMLVSKLLRGEKIKQFPVYESYHV